MRRARERTAKDRASVMIAQRENHLDGLAVRQVRNGHVIGKGATSPFTAPTPECCPGGNDGPQLILERPSSQRPFYDPSPTRGVAHLAMPAPCQSTTAACRR
jgi:hypothetical protein